MEDIVQILIFVGAMIIAVIGQSTKSKKKSADPSPEEVLKDMFPEIEVEQEPAEVPLYQPVQQEIIKPKRTPHPTKQVARPVPANTRPQTPSEPVRKVRISTRQEARRAFIHSEIFNRKY